MSLRLSQYHEYWNIGEEIDYLECRMGEAYSIPFDIKTNPPNPIPVDITNWTFAVNSEVYSATCEYDGTGNMTKIHCIEPQLPVRTVAGLTVVDIMGPQGMGTLLIPPDVNPNPNKLIFPDTANTMMNLITLTCTFPGMGGLDNVRKIMIGLLVRLG